MLLSRIAFLHPTAMKSAADKPRLTNNIRIGTAGWTLPKEHAHHFPEQGTHLERNAAILNCVEINSSFHRPHMLKTWQRWAACTPDDFRFAVKMPKTITHQAKLINTGALLQPFLQQATGLGEKLGPILIQLPPKLAYDEGLAHEFLTTFRELYPMDAGAPNYAVLEPRHATWFTPAVDRLLRDFAISRVAADPPKGSPIAGKPGGWQPLHYYRLHGAPRTYYSDYGDAFLKSFAGHLLTETPSITRETWVIFDNTALGHATANALALRKELAQRNRA
jgi:uncharacterized protein YecE (DUF72 family)